MKKLVYGILAGVALTTLAFFALAQPLVQNNVTGNECWNAGQGPGGTSTGFVCLYLVRNGGGMVTQSGSGAATRTATQQESTIAWKGTAPTTWNVTFPNPAFHGQIVSLTTDTTLTTMVTTTAASSPQAQTINGGLSGSTITAGTSKEWQFDFPSLTWFALR
jgi:hypothetical protein